jgi:acyl-CoA synthetase (AMP-forming)/AMP-acid ligase II
VPVELVERMKQELGFETVVTGYGLTEASGIATMCRHDDTPRRSAPPRAGDPRVEVLVVDDDGARCPRASRARCRRGYNVMREYFEDPSRRRRRSTPTAGCTPATSA